MQRRRWRMALGLGAVLLMALTAIWTAVGGREDTCEHAIVARRPRLAWTTQDVLQVTVANRSSPKVLAREFDGVRMHLRFDPDDPAERVGWLRKHHMSPDPDR